VFSWFVLVVVLYLLKAFDELFAFFYWPWSYWLWQGLGLPGLSVVRLPEFLL
jgi:hypothetical protein